MSDLRVTALDPSLTRAGLCKADGTTISLRLRAGRVDPNVPDWFSILAKCNTVRDWAWPHIAGSDLIVLEQPIVFAGHESSVEPLYALQFVLLQRCRAEGMADRVLRLHPASIQGFARNGVERKSFKGLAPAAKKAALEDLARENGWAGPHAGGSNDDEGEAYLGYCVGRHVMGEPVMEPTPYREKRARQWAAELARYRRSAA